MSSRTALGANNMRPGSHYAPDAKHYRRDLIQLAGLIPPDPVTRSHSLGARKRECIISLSRGKFAVIDENDLEFVMSRKWHWRPSANSIGNGYAVSGVPKESGNRQPDIFLHRHLIGAKPGEDVDHINRDSLDNRRCNLRIATRSQNIANCSYPTRPNQTGFRGVRRDKRRDADLYRAVLCVNYQRVRGQLRNSPIEAAMDYDELALAHFGEFATLNFPQGGM